jgi:small-conductance mechanosensitive channel
MQIFTENTDSSTGAPLLDGALNITPETLIVTILSLIIGYIIAKILLRWVKQILRKQNRMSEVAANLIERIVSILLYIIVVLIAVSFLGVDVDGIVLGLSAIIGLVVGFGMKDTINNFAAGIWIATMNLFDKGDEVTIAGHWGFVQEIGIMATQITSGGSNIITIPNGKAWNDSIINYTRNPERRIDQSFGVSYESDMTEVVQVALSIARNHPKVLDAPEPRVVFSEMADYSVKFTLRCWTKTPDYYGTRADLLRSLHSEFITAGIEIPYPHVDVAFRDTNSGEENGPAREVR